MKELDSLLSESKAVSAGESSTDSLATSLEEVVTKTAALDSATVDSTVHAAVDTSSRTDREGREGRLAETIYEPGNLFLLEINIPDSAEYWYQRVITEHPRSEVAPRALYTLADVYRSTHVKDRDASELLYRTLVEEYPGTDFANAARRFLEMDVEVATDPAAPEYARGEALLLEGNVEAALSVLRSLIREYPDSPSLPKSKYAIGWIFENLKINADSARGYYQQVVDEYPSSAYAQAVKAKLLAAEAHDEEQKSDLEPSEATIGAEKEKPEPEESRSEERKNKPPP